MHSASRDMCALGGWPGALRSCGRAPARAVGRRGARASRRASSHGHNTTCACCAARRSSRTKRPSLCASLRCVAPWHAAVVLCHMTIAARASHPQACRRRPSAQAWELDSRRPRRACTIHSYVLGCGVLACDRGRATLNATAPHHSLRADAVHVQPVLLEYLVSCERRSVEHT